jgi:drug/metabolite transporter (DMT)-like permease
MRVHLSAAPKSEAPPAARAPAPARRAAWTLLASAGLFGVMAVGVRRLAAHIPAPEIALVRFAAGVLAVAAALLLGQVDLRPRRWGWLGARGVFGGLAVVAYFSCIAHVGVGVATLLNYTAPIWSLLFSWLLLREPPRPGVLARLAVTWVGVALVVGGAGSLAMGWWQALGVLSAVSSGLALTSIRAVRRAGPDGNPVESAWTVFASFTALGLLSTVPWVAGRWVAPTTGEWMALALIAGVSIAAQLLMTRALQHVTAAGAGIIHQVTVVMALAGGLLLFGETLTLRAAMGSVLTIGGVVSVVLSSSRREAAVPARP